MHGLYTSVFAAGLLLGASANPLDRTEVFREPAQSGNGTLIYYASHARGVETRALATCGPHAIKCSKDTNVAQNDLCAALTFELVSHKNDLVPVGADQICHKGVDNANCCVSWSVHNPGIKKGDVVEAAQLIQDRCQWQGISGLSDYTKINGICTTVCLDNNGNSCKNT